MQTITVSSIQQPKVDAAKFLRTVPDTKVQRDLKPPEKRIERLDAPVVERLNPKTELIKGIVTGVVRRKRPAVLATLALKNGFVQKVETEVEEEDYTRVWIGYKTYSLFCFMSGHPGGTYPMHRLLIAQSLTKDDLEIDQQLVVPVMYDLHSVRDHFGDNIWDQNFKRMDAISSGRIKGLDMRSDVLYQFFSNIGTYVGVEIKIPGSEQMVKVFFDGRLQFMGLQPGVIEDPATRDEALEIIVRIVDKLSIAEI